MKSKYTIKQHSEFRAQGLKYCSDCELVKSFTDFWKNATNISGYANVCKNCIRARRNVKKKHEVTHQERNENKAIGLLYCFDCKIFKANNDFHKNKQSRTGHHNQCISCRKRQEYGISLEEYDQMLSDQNGVCAICLLPEIIKSTQGRTKSLAVDHCHTTGKVRGLLCINCNTSLGHYEKIKDSAKRYLND